MGWLWLVLVKMVCSVFNRRIVVLKMLIVLVFCVLNRFMGVKALVFFIVFRRFVGF